MARPKKSLAKWIGEAISDNMKEKPISQFSLVHMKGTVPLEIFKFDKFGTEMKESELAELMEDKANTHAQEMTGPQTFNVWAFYGQPKQEAYYVFIVMPVANDQDGYLTTEQPTPQGMLQQNMRWKEMDQGLVYRQQVALNAQMIQMIELQGRQLDRLQEERFSNGNMVMEMIAKTHDRAHELEMKKIEAQKASQMWGTVTNLLPAAVNTIFGREIIPQATEDTAIIEMFVTALIGSSTDAAEMMGKVSMMMNAMGVPAAGQGVLSSRIIREVEKRQKAAEAEHAAKNVVSITRVPSRKDAEKDVGGE